VPARILTLEEQVEAWRAASGKMKWAIRQEEFAGIAAPPPLTGRDLAEGFEGVALFYGFGDDGAGNADAVLSGKLPWQYARRRLGRRLWQSPYIDFDRADSFRLRPGAPRRPKGFYFARIQTGGRHQGTTVARMRERLGSDTGTDTGSDTGCGPEGLQLLCVTHLHLPEMMSERKMPFMALADYDVAPHGFNDFFDVPQLFCSNGVLGLGIGNAERNYPGFGIPVIRL
jgi:hypothetical protein